MSSVPKIVIESKTKSPALTPKAYRIVVSLMAVWLLACIVLSWASILDDALIHLRYADNLLHTHLITYDGIHPNYGVSSLLYVSLLAGLRSMIASPNLPRGVSSFAHILLFCGLAFILIRSIPNRASRVRLFGLLLLLLLIVPSAVRWLDDGMETGLALCFTSLTCWLIFLESKRPSASTTPALTYLSLVVLGFFTVLLRTELAMLGAIAFAILNVRRAPSNGTSQRPRGWATAALGRSHLLVGNLLGIALIVLKMHALLPDTALAKSHGLTSPLLVVIPTLHALVGGLSFGVGMLLLWLTTLLLLLRLARISWPIVLANSPFVLTLILASLRGQEIQGVRYLIWTLLFSVLWNILELAADARDLPRIEQDVPSRIFAYSLLTLIFVVQPLELSIVYPIMSGRSRLMATIPHRHLDVLQGTLGVAWDVGIIGYFSKARICDPSGLVDGRAFAQLSPEQRDAACANASPDFLYLDFSELLTFNQYLPVENWQVCGEFEMPGFLYKDIHYLIVPQATAKRICRETMFARPYPARNLILAGSSPESERRSWAALYK